MKSLIATKGLNMSSLRNFQMSKNAKIRLAIWALFLSVLVGTGLLADGGSGKAAETLAAGVSSSDSYSVQAASSNMSLPSLNGPTPDTSTAPSATGEEAVDFLPAWRWGDSEWTLDVSSDGGFMSAEGSMRSLLSTMASTGFLISSGLWSVLLNILRFGMSANFVSDTGMAQVINTGFASLSSSMIYLLGFFWVLLMIKAIREFMRGHVTQAIKSAAVFTLAMGGLFAMGNASQAAGDNPDAPGTMPWLATTISNKVDVTAGQIASGFGITQNSTAQVVKNLNQGGDILACENYMNSLHQRYVSLTSDGKGAPEALVIASKLWETTYFNSWTIAQFGQPRNGWDLGGRVACRQVEYMRNNKDSSIVSWATSGGSSVGVDIAAYEVDIANDDLRHKMVTAWAACSWTGSGWAVTDPFKDQVGGRITPQACAETFDADGPAKGTPFNIYYGHQEQLTGKTDAGKAAVAWNQAYYGNNTSDRFVQGAISFIVSAIFLFTLGLVGLGMIVAQFMLLVLLMVFPVTLILLGMQAPQGMRLLKLTGTTAVSKFMFSMLITFLTELILLGQRVAANIGDGRGTFNQLLYGLMPLMAFYVGRKILSTLGMGDILKPGGALSFMAASSMAATRDSKLQSMASGGSGSLLGGMAKKGLANTPGGQAAWRQLKASKAMHRIQRDWGFDRNSHHNQKERESEAKRKREERAKKQAENLEKFGTTDGALKRGMAKTAAYAKNERDLLKKGSLKGLVHDHLDRGKQAAGKRLAPFGNMKKTWQSEKGLAKGKALLDLTAGLSQFGSIPGGLGAVALGGFALGPAGLPLGAAVLGFGGLAALGGVAKIGFDKRSIKAEPVTVQADEYISSHVMAASMSAQASSRVKRAKGAERVEREINFVDTIVRSSAQRHLGNGFEGFTSIAQQAGAAEAYAKTLGLDRSEVLVSQDGLMLPDPHLSLESAKRAHMKIEGLAHGALWLDKETRARRDGETDEIYAARINTVMVERGLMTPDGQLVNVFEKAGLNIKDAKVRDDIEAWMNGKKHSKLDHLVFESQDSVAEERLVAAATRWVQQREDERDMLIRESQAVAQALVTAAESRIDNAYEEFKDRLPVFSSESGSFVALTQRLNSQLADARQKMSADEEKNVRAALGEARKKWDQQASALVEEFKQKYDDISAVTVDLKAANMTDLGQFEDLVTKVGKAFEEHEKELLDLQAKAYSGEETAVRAFHEAIKAKGNELAKMSAELEEQRQANLGALVAWREQELQERAKSGEVKQAVRASDFIKRKGLPQD